MQGQLEYRWRHLHWPPSRCAYPAPQHHSRHNTLRICANNTYI
jgi:hypothetical protein